jgi:hypothetical protein
MRVLTVGGPFATVELSALEVLILQNSLNEVCHGIDIPELHTRIGADEKEIRALLQEVSALYDRVDTSSLHE